MILKSKESIVAYRCPFCGSSMLSVVGIFRLSGDLIKLKCDCGSSELHLTRAGDDRVKLTVPCIICPKPHTFTLSVNSFFECELVTLACPFSGVNVAFIGRERQVRDALDATERELDAMLEEAELDDFDKLREANDTLRSDSVELAHLARFVITELCEDDALECACGDGEAPEYDFIISGDTITIYCHTCGAEQSFKIEAQSDADEFLLLTRLCLTPPDKK